MIQHLRWTAPPAQTDEDDQSIQPDVEKPEAPSEEALTDPNVQPDGTPVEEAPEAGSDESQTETGTSEPQAGDTEGGQIYIPGFGWVDNQGGGSFGTSAGDMYENGNKIGSMD